MDMPHLGHVHAATAVNYGRRKTDKRPRSRVRRFSQLGLFRRRRALALHPSVAHRPEGAQLADRSIPTRGRVVMQFVRTDEMDGSGDTGLTLQSPG